jgi:hypothetical protein
MFVFTLESNKTDLYLDAIALGSESKKFFENAMYNMDGK